METVVLNGEEPPPPSKANENRLFECRNNCDATFNSFKLLNRHIQTEHREVIENKVCKCKYCDERIRKKLLSRHVQNEHSLCKVDGCNERLPIFALKAHMLREHGNDYVHNLKETMKKKKKNAPRKCPVTDCDREFKKNLDLKKHMKNNHTTEESRCPCKYEGCNQTFAPWAMKEHISKEHEKQFEKECKICKVVFKSKQGWNKHRKKHIKEYFNQKVETANTDQNAENAEECDDSSVDDVSDDESKERSDDDAPVRKKKRFIA